MEKNYVFGRTLPIPGEPDVEYVMDHGYTVKEAEEAMRNGDVKMVNDCQKCYVWDEGSQSYQAIHESKKIDLTEDQIQENLKIIATLPPNVPEMSLETFEENYPEYKLGKKYDDYYCLPHVGEEGTLYFVKQYYLDTTTGNYVRDENGDREEDAMFGGETYSYIDGHWTFISDGYTLDYCTKDPPIYESSNTDYFDDIEEAISEEATQEIIDVIEHVDELAAERNDEEESDEDEENFLDDKSFDDLVKEAEDRLDKDADEPVDVTEEDIAEEVKKSDIIGGDDVNISRDEIIQILEIVKRVQNKEEFNIYRALPKSVQDRINSYIVQSGGVLNTIEGNTMRNSISEMLIDEFIDNISLNHYIKDFQSEMNELENKVNEEFSKMYKDYSDNRNEYIEKLMEDQEDPEKKEALGSILDSINDGFALERIKDAARNHKIKIKNYDLENPKRVFDRFLYKYQNSTQNIYSIYMANDTLYNHMKDEIDDDKDVLRFFIAIAKFCLNYSNENPTEHAFMYYAMYNPILLDVYKGEEYDEFAPAYKANVKEVIELLKSKPEEVEVSDTSEESKNKSKKKKKKHKK